jgi:tetratricopeptide (TPR) repeat protein
MFTTSQFRVFATEPGERALATARRLLQSGHIEAAEDAYLDLIDTQPDLKLAWGEYFTMLRNARRFEEALALSAQAADRFGDDAFPATLKGAALVELGRYREALVALEHAASLDPGLALVWHEAGYAAYRLGEYARALLALDRAFALEPHSGTLHLRGKILRSAGRYLAAEVAFEGAAEAAEFDEQRAEAVRQVEVTRRYALFGPTKPINLHESRQWFAETGAVPLTYHADLRPPSDEDLVRSLAQFAREQEWRFTTMYQTDAWPGWSVLADELGLETTADAHFEPGAVPLVVAREPQTGEPAWDDAVTFVRLTKAGLVFVLHQPTDQAPADIFGILAGQTGVMLDLATASEVVQHPNSVLQDRRLWPSEAAAEHDAGRSAP